MNEMKIDRADYELAASTKNDRVEVDRWVYSKMWLRHYRLLRVIAQRQSCSDERALALSIECERFADFADGAGREIDAARSYRDAMLYCFDGDWYDHGCIHLPSRFLRVRFACLLDRAEAFCACNPRFEGSVLADPEVREGRKLVESGCF